MHGYRSLEKTFLGGCLFSGRVAGRGDRTVTASAKAHASLRPSVPIRGACLPSCRRTRPNGEQTRGEITAGRALP